jgi:hypothetical protein
MKAYITGSRAITAQNSLEGPFPFEDTIPVSLKMSALEPDYKTYISPLKLRRMSRIVRMGLATALQCLKDTRIGSPGGIVTATGWGCLADTHKFLTEIGVNNEQALSPATFIQSTHNTVGGQIALMLGCQEYNSVYVHHTASFEHSLLDALMLIREGKNNILVGGVDEIMDADYDLKKQSGYWKKDAGKFNLPESETEGTIAGEGAAFFLLSANNNSRTGSVLRGSMVSSISNVGEFIQNLFGRWKIDKDQIDLILCGLDGDINNNRVYRRVQKELFPNSIHAYYKHLCGDFDTASAFALWLADKIIQNQHIPDSMILPGSTNNRKSLNHILLHHFTHPKEHAFILVSKADL